MYNDCKNKSDHCVLMVASVLLCSLLLFLLIPEIGCKISKTERFFSHHFLYYVCIQAVKPPILSSLCKCVSLLLTDKAHFSLQQ